MEYTQAGSVNRTKKSTEQSIRLSGKFIIKDSTHKEDLLKAMAEGKPVRININELKSKFEGTNPTYFGISLAIDEN